jgi:RNA-directed DNA polymerase
LDGVGRERVGYELAYLERVREAVGGGIEAEDAFVAYADALIDQGLPVLFSVAHLAHVTALNIVVLERMALEPARFYKAFRIPKRKGGSRQIEAPLGLLKHVQRWVDRHVARRLPISDVAHGFVRGRSIATNAAPHRGAAFVFRVDIRGFFDAITDDHVFTIFRDAGYSTGVAHALTALTTYRGVLPQGAPTSPALANVHARTLDERVVAIASAHDLQYTRYADDLTLSGGALAERAVRREVEEAVKRSGFELNARKTRVMTRKQRQIVTGIVTNDRLNWPRERRRWLRQEVYYLERYSVEGHLAHVQRGRSRYRDYIYGHVLALNAVRPDEARPLLERLDRIEWPL